ncbi:MAG: DUF2249 domain-containing protein, partial [Saccharopolyspora rectivirgula]
RSEAQMAATEAREEPLQELDVRPLCKPDKHPAIFATYAELPAGGSFVLINDHDPKHLRDEFEADHPGSYRWEYLQRERGDWRIRITKLASTPLPRVLVNTAAAEAADPGATGPVWTLQCRDRDLDSNIIALPAGGGIDAHTGPDVDVLVHVLAGSGQLTTELGTVELAPGALVWLPRRSKRAFKAGPGGLRYLTVHQRRQALVLEPAPARAARSE